MFNEAKSMKWKILIAIMAIVVIGCESPQQKEARLAKEKQEEAKREELCLEEEYRVPAILLALKYKVDEEAVFKLLAGESFLYGEGLSCFDEPENKKKLRDRIKAYSEQYDIPIDIIASIFIDYEAMSAVGL